LGNWALSEIKRSTAILGTQCRLEAGATSEIRTAPETGPGYWAGNMAEFPVAGDGPPQQMVNRIHGTLN
jgi:hypothetical protein